jgi:hypothetical protein
MRRCFHGALYRAHGRIGLRIWFDLLRSLNLFSTPRHLIQPHILRGEGKQVASSSTPYLDQFLRQQDDETQKTYQVLRVASPLTQNFTAQVLRTSQESLDTQTP